MTFVDQCRKRKLARGLNRTEIAREIGRPRNVVANFLRALGEYGSKKSGGRSTNLGKLEKRRITMMASNSTDSLEKIRSIYCSAVSKTTIWRTLKANSFIRPEGMRKCPTLTADHEKARMDFKFNLGGPDGFSSYWRDLRNDFFFYVKFRSFMIWWSQIDPAILKNLSTSMTERINQVISRINSCTDYYKSFATHCEFL
uniref:HTH_Tnp_Tc3_1 domain-containing protein n=1 Tax=Heterorhabditis bacteriophora TaxID=37862 RepID=A0A1I7XBF3_HETBA